MKILKVCFVGVGSIAKRHIKNLQDICIQREIDLKIDVFRHVEHESTELYNMGVRTVLTSIDDITEIYDIIFITNPTKLHLETLKKFNDYGKNFFIEKPISPIDQIAFAKKIEYRNDSIYYVACPLRYNAVIQYIKQHVDPSKVISVRSISSSYLPDWRPGTDYRQHYSAHKNMGGGVSIDLIHEWDYLTYLFGFPQNVQCMIGKKSNLEIDSEDYAIYIAEYRDKILELHLDYFGRHPIRTIELYTEEETIIGDIINNEVLFAKENKRIAFNEERDDYQKRELMHFLDLIGKEPSEEDGIDHSIQVLKLTQGEM